MKTIKKNILLIIILLLALSLRMAYLNSIPRGLHSDEASFMINAVAIMKTGRDEDNRILPIFLESINDPKPALYSYLQIPFFLLFGVSNMASRLPSVFLGIISIYLFYDLIFKTTKEKKIALIAAILVAISPWHIMYSRATQEVILSLFFLQLSLRLFQKFCMNKKSLSKKHVVKMLLVFFTYNLLAMYSYHSAKVLITLFYCSVLMWNFLIKKDGKNSAKYILTILATVVLPLIITMSNAMTRFSAIGILQSELPVAILTNHASKVNNITPLPIIRSFFNKPVFFTRFFVDLYFRHFNGKFLFLEGGQTGRYRIPTFGVFHPIDILPMLFGIYIFIAKKKYKHLAPYFFIFLALTPVAAALTEEGVPNATRVFPMIMPLTFFVALGLKNISQVNKTTKTALFSVFLAYYTWGIPFFLHQMFVEAPLYQPWSRSRDYEKGAQVISDIGGNFDDIIISNNLLEIYIYLWINNEISITDLQQQAHARFKKSYSIDKIEFNKINCDFSNANERSLLLGSVECLKYSNQPLIKIANVYFDDMQPGFSFYRLDSKNPDKNINNIIIEYFGQADIMSEEKQEL